MSTDLFDDLASVVPWEEWIDGKFIPDFEFPEHWLRLDPHDRDEHFEEWRSHSAPFRTREIMSWIGRFRIAEFENDRDAAAFKMRWL